MNSDPPYRTYVEVSLPTIQENFRSIASQLSPAAQVMPVVKANAYGHGALPVSRALVAAGTRWLAVSSTMEGVTLRRGGIPTDTRILVMAGVHDFDWPQIVTHQLTPVLHNLRDVSEAEKVAAAAGRVLPFHFKFDTGLSRLGSLEPIQEIIRTFLNLRITRLEGIMTHFASAANLTSPKTQQQADQLTNCAELLRRSGLPKFLVHVDATNSLHLARHHADVQLVRPGHAIYGYVTEPKTSVVGRLHVKPALSWTARVILTKSLPPGVDVGYGSHYRTTRDTVIAVLAVGYADGYPHQLTNRAYVLIRGNRAPVVGAVSMDLTTVDVTHLPPHSNGQAVIPGEAAVLLGRAGNQQISAIQLGRMAGTISYAILCGIGERVPRLYVDQTAEDYNEPVVNPAESVE
ncbi:MAG: alanine racemase [Bryobacterales bacterium]|nr:alanine racemase [Bryobacterales bacterium]